MPISFPKPDAMDISTHYELVEDFLNPASATVSDLMAWTSAGDGGTGTKAGPSAAAETLQIDYIKCIAER